MAFDFDSDVGAGPERCPRIRVRTAASIPTDLSLERALELMHDELIHIADNHLDAGYPADLVRLVASSLRNARDTVTIERDERRAA